MNGYDIAIIGLGPAGATIARLLDKRFRIIAIDKKSDAKDSFRKPCDGLLATDAQKALSKFNLTATSFISPSSLEGISYAFNSAHELAKVFNSGDSKHEWKINLKLMPLKIRLLLKYLKSPFMYRPLLRKLIMKTGVGSIDVTGE